MADAKLGIAMTGPFSEPTPAAAEIAKEAEKLDYSSLWVAEFAGPDAIVTLTYHAVHTSRIMLGTGVLPIQIRTPAVMGMAFLTLNEISGGRAVAGIGVSSPGLVETSHGASYRKPVTAMREYVQILRQFFNEGRAKFEGQVYRTNLRLAMHLTQKQRPRIYMAALNPPMVKLAGEVADGVLFNFCPPEMVADRIKIVPRRGGRCGPQSRRRRYRHVRFHVRDGRSRGGLEKPQGLHFKLRLPAQLRPHVLELRFRGGTGRGAPVGQIGQARYRV